jgi:hypothetical protein
MTKEIIIITKNNKKTTFYNKNDATEWIRNNTDEDEAVNQTYNERVWRGPRYICYTIAFSQRKQDARLNKIARAIAKAAEEARLDIEAKDKMNKYLTDTFDERIAIKKKCYSKMLVKELRWLCDELFITLPKKIKKAELVGIITHNLLTTSDANDIFLTNRNTIIPTGEEEE